MIGLESRFINSPTGIKLAPTSNYGAGPGYYGQTIPNTGTPIIPFGVHSPDASINYTNTPQIPETSWWDKLKGSIDKDFLAYAAMSMGGGQSGRSRSGGGGGGGGGGSRGGGGGMKPAGFLPPILPNIPAQAPNPGFYLNLPREQKNRYSGGF